MWLGLFSGAEPGVAATVLGHHHGDDVAGLAVLEREVASVARQVAAGGLDHLTGMGLGGHGRGQVGGERCRLGLVEVGQRRDRRGVEAGAPVLRLARLRQEGVESGRVGAALDELSEQSSAAVGNEVEELVLRKEGRGGGDRDDGEEPVQGLHDRLLRASEAQILRHVLERDRHVDRRVAGEGLALGLGHRQLGVEWRLEDAAPAGDVTLVCEVAGEE